MTQDITADYLIAGGGIAGLVLAAKLARTGKSIVVLDQGPRITEEDRARLLARSRETLNDFVDYNDDLDETSVTPHTSEAEGDGVVEWTAMRLFGLGGTALHFEGIMVRPLEKELRVRSLFGYGRDWPITYAELEPWLLRAEHEIGVSGNEDNPYASFRSGPFPMPAHAFSYFDRDLFAPALERLGIVGHSCPRGVSSVPYRGRSACQACRACKFCPSGARYSPDRVHLPLIQGRDNVTILDKRSLRRLETGANGSRIVAAHVTDIREAKSQVVRAEQYVLALGGVETPRMLMLSADGSAHRHGLGNMGGQLGRGFSDHLNLYVTVDAGRNVGSRLGFETMISDHFRAKVDRARESTFIIFGAPAMDWFPIGNEATSWATADGVLSLESLRDAIPRIATLTTMTELEGGGMLTLDDSAVDAFGAPVARVTMPLSKWDLSAVDRLASLAPEIGNAMGARHVSEVARDELGLGYHPSGATAMAQTPDGGVCDPNLKVFGLENLHVVSNSVFPHMGANPPTLTIAALALRLAAHLEGQNIL